MRGKFVFYAEETFGNMADSFLKRSIFVFRLKEKSDPNYFEFLTLPAYDEE